MEPESVLLRLTALLALGVGAQWLAWRFRLPSILLLLMLGIAIGPGLDFVEPDELLGDLLVPTVSLAVAIILFEGGLNLRFRELPAVGGVLWSLIIVGAMVTWVIGAAAAYSILGLSFDLSVLLGAVLVVTGPTVIIPLLEHIRPIGRVATLLKWEGIIIDPLGAMLTVLVFEAIALGGGQETAAGVTGALLRTLLAGGAIGLAGAAFLGAVLWRYLVPDQLQNPVSLMVVVLVAAGADLVQSESGLFAATVMGIALANQRFVSVRHILEFKESLRVLLIGTLFIVLAARLEGDDITRLDWRHAAFLAVLILGARPAAVAVSTFRSRLRWNERAFLAWMAPRGIVAASVASIFSLRLAEEGVADAAELVPVTFAVIIGTIAVYGATSWYAARVLDVSAPNPQGVLIVGAHAWAREIAAAIQDEELPVVLVDTNRENVSQAQMRGLSAHYANILSEDISDEIDISGIGRLLALTPNEEVNSLAAQQFIQTFGRAEVYQLATKTDVPAEGRGMPDEQTIPQHLRGRLLFDNEATFKYLEDRFRAGAVIKATPLTEEFTFDDFTELYGETALPLFLVGPGKTLSVFSTDRRPTPRAGQTLISLVDETAEAESFAAAGAAANE